MAPNLTSPASTNFWLFGLSACQNFIVIKIRNKFQRDTTADLKGKFPQKV